MTKESSSAARKVYEQHLKIVNSELRKNDLMLFPDPVDTDPWRLSYLELLQDITQPTARKRRPLDCEKDLRIEYYATVVDYLANELAQASGKRKIEVTAQINAELKKRGALGRDTQRLEAAEVDRKVLELWNQMGTGDPPIPERARAKRIVADLPSFRLKSGKSMQRSLGHVRETINKYSLRTGR